MVLSKNQIRQIWLEDKKLERKHLAMAVAAALAVFLFCLCFRYNAYYFEDKFVPLSYFKSLFLAARLSFARLFGTEAADGADVLIDGIGRVTYLGAIARLKLTLMSFVSGAGVALAGAVFQTAYKNPMASPNMLGATAGVSLGNVLVVMLYSAAAYENLMVRYRFCYGFTALCVGAILLLGKLAGDKKENYSVIEMVMVGSIISQVLRVFSMYIMYNLPDEDLLLYQEINMGINLDLDAVSLIIFFSVMLGSVLPVCLLSYRMNVMGMNRLETTALGVNAGPLRMTGQICGVLMMTCSMIHCGQVGMISMVIPYIVRRVTGADFRYVAVFSIFAGGILVMFCRLIASFVLIEGVELPITFIINLFLTPVFMVILARRRGSG